MPFAPPAVDGACLCRCRCDFPGKVVHNAYGKTPGMCASFLRFASYHRRCSLVVASSCVFLFSTRLTNLGYQKRGKSGSCVNMELIFFSVSFHLSPRTRAKLAEGTEWSSCDTGLVQTRVKLMLREWDRKKEQCLFTLPVS